MESNKNEMNELLKQSMRFNEGEVPEPNIASYKKLRKMIRPKTKPKNIFRQFLSLEVKLYQASLAMVAVVIMFVMVHPLQSTNNMVLPGSGGYDTASAFKGSSLKHDSFLVKNFSTTIY